MTGARRGGAKLAWALCLLALAPSSGGLAADDAAEIEAFLRSAAVTGRELLGSGVTNSHRLTLEAGGVVRHAVWKTIDEYSPVRRFDDGGLPELGFRDTYRNEIAAWELDKLLELGLVPPTVERRIKGQRGSLQLYVENAMTESERLERRLASPDPERFNRQMHTLRLWHRLIGDRDFQNVGNVLFDRDTFRLWSIDHSRAFQVDRDLIAPADLQRFSRGLLEKLRRLDAEELRASLGRWLSKRQLEALLARRDRILEIAARRVAENGEAATLFP